MSPCRGDSEGALAPDGAVCSESVINAGSTICHDGHESAPIGIDEALCDDEWRGNAEDGTIEDYVIKIADTLIAGLIDTDKINETVDVLQNYNEIFLHEKEVILNDTDGSDPDDDADDENVDPDVLELCHMHREGLKVILPPDLGIVYDDTVPDEKVHVAAHEQVDCRAFLSYDDAVDFIDLTDLGGSVDWPRGWSYKLVKDFVDLTAMRRR
jgi:hypothetical protein